MDFKMEINRLTKSELRYELKVRGINESLSVETQRKTLRSLVRLEKAGKFTFPVFPYTIEEELTAIADKIKHIKGLVDDFSDVKQSAAYKKLTSIVAHIFYRLNRLPSGTTEQNNAKSKLIVQLISCEAELKIRAKKSRAESTPNKTAILDLSSLHLPDHDTSTESSSSDESQYESKTKSIHYIKPVPVREWNLTFSGEQSKLSLNAFLERVEELRVARGVTSQHIFTSAIDLFEGKALIWYRANKGNFENWTELVCGLREEFHSIDYDEKLFDEIKMRTQGPDESIGIYLSVMQNLFARLSKPLPECSQLRIILKNVLPIYQMPLSLVEIKSIPQLLQLIRRIECSQSNMRGYVAPSKCSMALEPDLAYVYREQEPFSKGCFKTENQGGSRSCWICKEPGHVARDCKSNSKLKCFKCGKEGFKKSNCPNCQGNSKSG